MCFHTNLHNKRNELDRKQEESFGQGSINAEAEEQASAQDILMLCCVLDTIFSLTAPLPSRCKIQIYSADFFSHSC